MQAMRQEADARHVEQVAAREGKGAEFGRRLNTDALLESSSSGGSGRLSVPDTEEGGPQQVCFAESAQARSQVAVFLSSCSKLSIVQILLLVDCRFLY